MAVKFRTGQQLVSAVDSTAVIVIRASVPEGELTCGGVLMTAPDEAAPAPAAQSDPALMDGTQIGKRYVDEADTIQVLCTKAGRGTLALDGKPLMIQAAKPLPASD
jgi:hypothetical protein